MENIENISDFSPKMGDYLGKQITPIEDPVILSVKSNGTVKSEDSEFYTYSSECSNVNTPLEAYTIIDVIRKTSAPDICKELSERIEKLITFESRNDREDSFYEFKNEISDLKHQGSEDEGNNDISNSLIFAERNVKESHSIVTEENTNKEKDDKERTNKKEDEGKIEESKKNFYISPEPEDNIFRNVPTPKQNINTIPNHDLGNYNYLEPEISTFFEDFVLPKQLNFNNKLVSKGEYVLGFDTERFFNSYIDHIVNTLTNGKYEPIVITTGIQFFIMFFNAYKQITDTKLTTIGIIAIKMAVQLEHDMSEYDSLRDTAKKFHISFDKLLETEIELVCHFKGFYFDNAYTRLSIDERKKLLESKSRRTKYYEFLKSHSLYINSSVTIANKWCECINK